MTKFNIDPRYEFHPAAVRFPASWSCIDDRTYDGAPDGSNMIGWGATQAEALEDLERLFEEQADYQQMAHECEAERLGACGFPFSDAQIDAHQERVAHLLGFSDEDL